MPPATHPNDSPTNEQPPAPTRPAGERFAHIDTLRAVAALMVVCAHAWEDFLPVASGVDPKSVSWVRYTQIGFLGVLIFFSISGFVIYGTLRGPREGAGRRFVVSRFFRLFPAYWVTMVAGLLCIWWWQGLAITKPMIAANATMLPVLFGQPQILGSYWTLETELVFYVLCWLLWRGGWLENEKVLAGLVVGMSLAWFAVKGLKGAGVLPEEIQAGWKNLPRHLGIMFWGAYFRIVYDQTDGFRQSCRDNRKVWVLVILTVAILCVGGPRQYRFFIQPGRSFLAPYVLAPLIIWAWVAWLRVRVPVWAWLGKISYSIYLFHLVVLLPLLYWIEHGGGGQWRGLPVTVYVAVIVAATVALSAVTYYVIELPAINLGKRLAGRRAATGVQAAP